MMLQIVVEVAGTVCDADCSIFSQIFDRQPLPTELCVVVDDYNEQNIAYTLFIPNCPTQACLKFAAMAVH